MKHLLPILVLSLCLSWGCQTIEKPTPQPGPIPGKLENVPVALLADKELMGANEPNKDVMFAAVSDVLGKHLTIMVDPEKANALIYLWLKTDKRHVDSHGQVCWVARVGTRAVRKESGQQYWNFEVSTGDRDGNRALEPGCPANAMTRVTTVEDVAKATARKILKQIKHNKQVAASDTYEVTFARFGFRGKQKIKDAMLALNEGKKPYARLLPGVAAGAVLKYKIKWLRTDHSQAEVESIIREHVEELGVALEIEKTSPGFITFVPQLDDGDF